MKTHKKEAAIVGSGTVAAGLMVAMSKAGVPVVQDSSIRKSRKKELADGNFFNLSDVPAGTVLICELTKFTHHSGIYLGNGEVAELFGDGRYQSVSLEEFIHGAPGENFRTGTHAYATCDADGNPLGSPEVAKYARRFIGSTTDYKLDANNCHLFSATCHADGGIQKIQGLKRAINTFSIGKLCHQIKTFHKTETLRWLPIENHLT
ncbi:MAG: hypothetical protein IKW49_03360 [Opitutales bacterium]|nr:hypothetical protein [Opitutales bacterium]